MIIYGLFLFYDDDKFSTNRKPDKYLRSGISDNSLIFR
jgi:hypothetical protein